MPRSRRDTAVALPVSRALISWHSLYSGNGAQREIHFNPNIPYVAGDRGSVVAAREPRATLGDARPQAANRSPVVPSSATAGVSAADVAAVRSRSRHARYARERRPWPDETFAGDDVCPNRRSKSRRERRDRSSPGGPGAARKLKISLWEADVGRARNVVGKIGRERDALVIMENIAGRAPRQ